MKILLADDELAIISSLKNLLLSEGHSVDTAMSGTGVIKMHNQNNYDALIIDVDFQDGINGIETSSRIRLKDKKIKIIVITAFINSSTNPAVLKLGANLLIKPIEEANILKLLKEEIL